MIFTRRFYQTMIAVVITVALLQACVSCSVSKFKQVEQSTKDSAAISTYDSSVKNIKWDTSESVRKIERLDNTEDTYIRTTVDTPIVIHVKDSIIIERVKIVREAGKKVIQTVYVDSFSSERRKLIEENKALKKQQAAKVLTKEEVKVKEKETKWPVGSLIVIGICLLLVVAALLYRRTPQYKRLVGD
jgi:hypothetical protein